MGLAGIGKLKDFTESYLAWCRFTFFNYNLQNRLNEMVISLVNEYFQGEDSYAVKKFIQSFAEGLGYQEHFMMYKRGVHPDQLQYGTYEFARDQEKYNQTWKEIKNIMINEILRQSSNFSVFITKIQQDVRSEMETKNKG